jgi:hypothetical protein
MLTIEMVLAMEALLASETLLPDLALILLTVGIWIELNPRRPAGPRKGAARVRDSGAVPAILFLMIMVLPESSFGSTPPGALGLFVLFAALVWLRKVMVEARLRAA